MDLYSQLIWLLCISVVISEVQGRSIKMRKNIKSKRCGVKDENTIIHKLRHGRSVGSGDVMDGHWAKEIITFTVVNGPKQVPWWVGHPTITQERVEELARQAFAEWAPHCGLTFQPWKECNDEDRDSCRPDIKISFERRKHGDEDPFDGPGFILGHADYPNEDSVEIHFDDDEIWVDTQTSSDEEEECIASFYPILLHEMGHALGLTHSYDRDTIMYGAENSHVQHLTEGDIKRMRDLYGISEANFITSTPSHLLELPTSTQPEEATTSTPSEEVPTSTPSEELSFTISEGTINFTTSEEDNLIFGLFEELPTSSTSEAAPTSTPSEETNSIFALFEELPISEELPTSSPSEQLPTSTPSEQLPTSTPSEHLPTSTPSEQLPTSNTTEQLPTSTPSEQLPSSTPSEQLPTSTPSEQLPSSTPSEQLPTSSPSKQLPTSTPSEQLPTSTPSEQLPISTPSEQLPTSTPSEQLPTSTLSEQLPTSSEQLPTSTLSEQLPTSTLSEQLPTSTPSEQLPSSTPSEQLPTSTPSEQLPTSTPSEQLPSSTPSEQLPTSTPSEQLPTSTPSAQLPTSTPSAQLPTSTPSEKLPTSTPSEQLPTSTPSEQLPTSTPSENLRLYTLELMRSIPSQLLLVIPPDYSTSSEFVASTEVPLVASVKIPYTTPLPRDLPIPQKDLNEFSTFVDFIKKVNPEFSQPTRPMYLYLKKEQPGLLKFILLLHKSVSKQEASNEVLTE